LSKLEEPTTGPAGHGRPQGDPYTLAFNQIGQGDIGLVGGKGANLGELVGAGLPIPGGFCITATAYRHFLRLTGIDEEIADVLQGREGDHERSAEELSSLIGGLIQSQEMPQSLSEPVLASYRRMSAQHSAMRVAVRSSATAEDLPGFSFAGQQDTYLGIRGDQELLASVRRCWASLWTPRAISYRQSRGFRHEDVYIAVVVQEMFPSEVSGVLFSVDPLTGNRRRMVVNASWGLGEAIVSGLVDADYWILDRENSAVLEERIGNKLNRIDQSPDGSGVVHIPVAPDDQGRPCLSPGQLEELVRLGNSIEQHYGYPQDVEWGYAGGRFAILQAREVTGVEIDFGEELDRWNRTQADDDEIVWTRAWADSFQTAPTTPLMYTIQQKLIARSYDDMYELYGLKSFLNRRLYRWHRTRPYHSTTYEEARLQLIPRFARTNDSLIYFPPEDRDRIRNLPFQWWKVVYAQLHALLTAPRYSFWRCADTFYREYPQQVARFKAAANIDFKMASFEQLMHVFDVSEECFIDHARSTTPGIMDYCYFLILALSNLLDRWVGDVDQSRFAALMSGISTRTVQENAEIWRIARRAAISPVLQEAFSSPDAATIMERLGATAEGSAYLASIQAYIAENGHRGGSERDLAFPRWRHRPELFVNALRSLISGDQSSDPEITEAKMVERRERTTAEVLQALRASRGGFIKAKIFETVLRWTLKYVRMRDDQRYYCDHYMTIRHDIFLAIGDRMIERTLISERSDIFFLGLEEIQDLWGGRLPAVRAKRRIEIRKVQHEKYGNDAPPFFIRGGLPVFIAEDTFDGTELRGIAASPGRVRARARVCKTLDEASKLEKGDILVAVATDPGWTPAFSVIAGVVVETGGPLAHATLVSREYGIPCVTTVSRATERIRDRQMITIDGYSGCVLLEEEMVEGA